ncbi:Hypothetical protein D9617_15g042880 [Elsinoe fawcettii]|nr:Hypothetical protein D9617_15g042880 [Elsinoe fawcettii]
MSTAAPTIPPRPSRSAGQGQATLSQDMPQIPPRPHRRSDRSVSPNREAFTRSPLNELPPGSALPQVSSPNYPVFEHHRAPSNQDLPIRPPSVQLPSIGHEGDEYANLELHRTESSGSGGAEQKRNVAADLPMHQPKASVPQATATSRIQGVTRTDSDKANALSKTLSHEEGHSEKHSLRAKASFNRSNPHLHHSRPGSIHEPEHDQGIPEIGLQVPMYPNAGDVQAPSPAQSAPPHSAGIGFFNDGSRNHHRRRSSRQEYGPPGSYGMHGHGLEPRDQFEKAWYQRHPEELAKEKNHHYDPGHPRSEWALSSDDLNKLVHGKRVASGETPDVVSTPNEQIGYLASEQYSSRQHSPKPTPLSQNAQRPSSGSQPHVESPLRKSSFPFNQGQNHGAVESDDEDETTIRVHPPERRTSKLRGYSNDVDDLGLRRGHTNEEGGHTDERGYDLPILASDEIAKYPGGEFQQPAVDPEERGYDSEHHYPSNRRPSSRDKDSSRPTSMHGEPLSRFISQDRHEGSGVGTPLEEIQEYEPLFPDDDDKIEKKPVNKGVRPDLARHHFPSQDIWEDTPESLAFTATVSTPDLPPEPKPQEETKPSAVFEHPDVEAKRKNGPLPTDRAHFLPKETEKYASPHYSPGVLQDLARPGMQQRFPSQDIWEDNPDSLRLTTTVSHTQDEITSPKSPEESSRTIPSIPARPQKKPETSPTERRAPTIPDRPKPSVPSRPLPRSSNATPSSPLAQDGAPKAKPAVPSRPAGKLAGIKASFMNDLNSRLQLGPTVPKKEEPKEEKEPEPLVDARKGRARGPARRKPAAQAEEPTGTTTFSISSPRVIFSLNEEGTLTVQSSSPAASTKTAQSVIDLPKTSAEEKSALPAENVGAEGDLPVPALEGSQTQDVIEGGLREALQDNDAKRDTPLGTNVGTTTDDTKDAVGTVAEREGGIGPVKSEKSATESLQSVLAKDQGRKDEGAGKDEEVQTGETTMRVKSPEGKEETITAFVGGRVPEGDVVVKNGEEVSEGTQA